MVVPALTELCAISVTFPRNVVSGKASINTCAVSPTCRRATSVSSTFTFVSSTDMSLIVSKSAWSLLNVPGTAVSPCCTASFVMRPSIGACCLPA